MYTDDPCCLWRNHLLDLPGIDIMSAGVDAQKTGVISCH